MQQTLQNWLKNTAGTPLYAVLANTNGAEGIKAYYREDGSRTPFGLYANTQYANWFEVMPVLVQINDGSPFLRWVAETPLRNWGWLARSPLPQATITEHLVGLTQVIMPSGKAVFFRYWDGQYLPGHIDYYGNQWRDILPVFSDSPGGRSHKDYWMRCWTKASCLWCLISARPCARTIPK